MIGVRDFIKSNVIKKVSFGKKKKRRSSRGESNEIELSRNATKFPLKQYFAE